MALCLFAISACTPSYVNTEDLGQKASRAEIVNFYSGNSILLGNTTEIYYAPDGTIKLVRLDRPGFAIGTWEATNNDTLLVSAVSYLVTDGQVLTGASTREASIVYIQPDGSAILDILGGTNKADPRPTPGFGAENRFNELLQMAGL
jgi:hypothetical protein